MNIVRTTALHLWSDKDRYDAFRTWAAKWPWPSGVPKPEVKWGVVGPSPTLGCVASHVNAWNEFLVAGGEEDDYLLLLESDARWGNGWAEVWPKVRADLAAAKTDTVWFGGAHGTSAPRTATSNPRIVIPTEIYRTHALAIRRSAVAKCTRIVTAKEQHIDVALSRAIEAGDLTARAVSPFVFAQKPGGHWYAWNGANREGSVPDSGLDTYAEHVLGRERYAGDVVLYDKDATPGQVARMIEADPELTAIAFVPEGIAVLSRDPKNKTKLPGLLTQAANFAKAATVHAAHGLTAVTDEQYKDRLDTCSTCPHLNNKRCGLCGCPVEKKAKWATSSCPDSPPRWSLL